MTPRNPLACGKTVNPPIYRVLAKCEVVESGCWEFRGSLTSDGYGRVNTGSRKDGTRTGKSTHRVSYEHFIGPIPEGLSIDHLCRNTICVNPDHLEAVPIRVNILRGMSPLVVLGRNNVCKRGHSLLDEENVAIRRDGARACRKCTKINNDNRRDRIRAQRLGDSQ